MTQSTYRQAFGLKILTSAHPRVRRLKAEGYQAEIHGNKFWNSSFLIMDYLKRHPLKSKAKVLEVGCGWGLLGLFCAKHFDAEVVGIDADDKVAPYLALHAEMNGLEMAFEKKTFQQLTTRYLAQFDLIVGADICFWDELSTALFNLIKRAQRAEVPQIIIADPCRGPFEHLTERTLQTFPCAKSLPVGLRRPARATGELLIVKPSSQA